MEELLREIRALRAQNEEVLHRLDGQDRKFAELAQALPERLGKWLLDYHLVKPAQPKPPPAAKSAAPSPPASAVAPKSPTPPTTPTSTVAPKAVTAAAPKSPAAPQVLTGPISPGDAAPTSATAVAAPPMSAVAAKSPAGPPTTTSSPAPKAAGAAMPKSVAAPQVPAVPPSRSTTPQVPAAVPKSVSAPEVQTAVPTNTSAAQVPAAVPKNTSTAQVAAVPAPPSLAPPEAWHRIPPNVVARFADEFTYLAKEEPRGEWTIMHQGTRMICKDVAMCGACGKHLNRWCVESHWKTTAHQDQVRRCRASRGSGVQEVPPIPAWGGRGDRATRAQAPQMQTRFYGNWD